MNDINMPCCPEFLLVLFGYRNVSRTSTKRLLLLLSSFLESCKNIYTYIWQFLLMCIWNLIQWTSAVTFLISFHMLSVHFGITDKIVISVVVCSTGVFLHLLLQTAYYWRFVIYVFRCLVMGHCPHNIHLSQVVMNRTRLWCGLWPAWLPFLLAVYL